MIKQNTPADSSSNAPKSSLPAVVEKQVYLSDQQRLALDWLTNGGNISDAARFADVCRQTVSRWLHEDADFRAVYDAWRDQLTLVTDGQLDALAEPAINTLAHAILHGKDARAAQFVLKHLDSVRRWNSTQEPKL